MFSIVLHEFVKYNINSINQKWIDKAFTKAEISKQVKYT